MDNKIFKINGRTKQQLRLALEVLLLDEYGKMEKVKGWYYKKNKGLILTWHINEKTNTTPFTDRMGRPSEIGVEELTEQLWSWLQTEEAKNTEDTGEWEDKYLDDSDVTEERGWLLYTEKWGHISETKDGGTDHYSIAAIKPTWLWYGK